MVELVNVECAFVNQSFSIKIFRKMKKINLNKALAAKTTFPCVDLKYQGNNTVIKPKQTRRGSLTYVEEDEKFEFKERDVPSVPQPQLHWRPICRTLHGKASINAQHVKVEFYVHHDGYVDGRDLADILANEIETIGDNLCDLDLEEEVNKCY